MINGSNIRVALAYELIKNHQKSLENIHPMISGAKQFCKNVDKLQRQNVPLSTLREENNKEYEEFSKLA